MSHMQIMLILLGWSTVMLLVGAAVVLVATQFTAQYKHGFDAGREHQYGSYKVLKYMRDSIEKDDQMNAWCSDTRDIIGGLANRINGLESAYDPCDEVDNDTPT